VRTIGLTVGLFAIPLAAVVALAIWGVVARPSPPALMRSIRLAAAGVGIAVGVALLLRAIVGSDLPSFIPPEESAAPGLSAGLAAGLIEEVLIRLAVLPVALALARQVAAPLAARVIAVVVAATAFTALHHVGPGAAPFVPATMRRAFSLSRCRHERRRAVAGSGARVLRALRGASVDPVAVPVGWPRCRAGCTTSTSR
jgi:hypothetical protein